MEGEERRQQVRHFLLKPLLRSFLEKGIFSGYFRGRQGEKDEEVRLVAEESSVVAQIVGITTRKIEILHLSNGIFHAFLIQKGF